jgi:response regulator RpfG family c-di-GMP phosphodiesterase
MSESELKHFKSTSTILCVDDEPNILSALQRLLSREGYVVKVASSASEGIRLLESQPFVLVISDLRMPEIDGIEFLVQVRARWPETLRILLTGQADMAKTVSAINQGEVYRFIAKPWNNDELLLNIRNAIEYQYLVHDRNRLFLLTQEQNKQLLLINEHLETMVLDRTSELRKERNRVTVANEKLKVGFTMAIKVFSSLIELSEGQCSGHAHRVAELSRRIAEHIKLDRRYCQDLVIAALLHDIGKIDLPESLRLKRGSEMNNQELEKYRTHLLKGSEVLMAVEELRPAGRLLRAQHERYDGLGYPEGLKADEIPLAARILAVANDYDGLLTATNEHDGNVQSSPLNYIQHWQGKRYDPNVVNSLVAVLDSDSLGAMRSSKLVLREIGLKPDMLEAGMVLSRDLVSKDGSLMLAEGYTLDEELILILRRSAAIDDPDLLIYVDGDKIN